MLQKVYIISITKVNKHTRDHYMMICFQIGDDLRKKLGKQILV